MESKTKKPVFYVLGLLIIILIIGSIMYFLLPKGDRKNEKAAQDNKKGYKLDISILENNFFDNLTHYAVFPLKPGEPGRKNPFEPY